jgi:hypothetical protein
LGAHVYIDTAVDDACPSQKIKNTSRINNIRRGCVMLHHG